MKNSKKLWQKLLPSIIALVVVIVFFVMFIVNENKRIAVQNGRYISDVAERTASHVASGLSSATATLGTIAAICRAEGDGYPEDLKRASSAFDSIDYISVDQVVMDGGKVFYNGTLYGFSSGSGEQSQPDVVIKVSSNPQTDEQYTYCEELALGVNSAGQAGICSNLQGATSVRSNGLSFYAAIFNGEGVPTGVLVGRYDDSSIKKFFKSSFFGEASGVYIINSAGEIVGATDDGVVVGSQKYDAYDVLRIFLQNGDIDDISHNLSQGISLKFTFNGVDDWVDACVVRLPLEGYGTDGWIILQTFPSTFFAQMQRLVNLEGLQLGLGLFFALVLYFGIIIISSVQNKKLVKANKEMAYVVEGLANMYDRFVYVNLNENQYRYIANTLPEDESLPDQGNYDLFKNYMISTFMDAYDRTRLAQKLEAAQIKSDMADGTSQLRYEYRMDREKWEDLNIICLSRKDGKASEVLFARQNISELKQRELQSQAVLKEAVGAAEEANRAKSHFLSSMSHDIRTPMNAVLGFSELIEKWSYAPEKVTEYTKKIRAAGQHLLGLIDDILDMSKIESGKISLNISRFSMTALIEAINAVITPQVNQKNQSYFLHREGDLDVYFGDGLRLGQIIINILSNAVKYTPEYGRIDFTLRASASGNGNIHNLQFIISDTGIGMSKEFIARLYQPFEREQNSVTDKVHGIGLGMAITKSLVELMGGTIDVESAEGRGTVFTINLQLAADEYSDAAQQNYNICDNLLEGMTFLVAEDNQINSEILCDFLGMAGASYDVAENGEQAVNLFERNGKKYDAILMDVQMPVMDGYEATKTIRLLSDPYAQKVPIVAMTANTYGEDVRRALASGMNAYISKPVSLEAITDTIARLKSNLY